MRSNDTFIRKEDTLFLTPIQKLKRTGTLVPVLSLTYSQQWVVFLSASQEETDI